MLCAAGQLPVRDQDLVPLPKRNSDRFEILTRLFAVRLTDEWLRGAQSGYQVVEDDIPLLKGQWRVGEQDRRPERDHVLSVAHDEYTADNDLKRIFRYVVERIRVVTRDSGRRRLCLGGVSGTRSEGCLRPHAALCAHGMPRTDSNAREGERNAPYRQ